MGGGADYGGFCQYSLTVDSDGESVYMQFESYRLTGTEGAFFPVKGDQVHFHMVDDVSGDGQITGEVIFDGDWIYMFIDECSLPYEEDLSGELLEFHRAEP